MWTDSEGTWYQVPLLALMGFALVVVLLRLSGKRTVAKFNMYDMVVTFTIGSLLSSRTRCARASMRSCGAFRRLMRASGACSQRCHQCCLLEWCTQR